jgi:hypothetical protein
MAYETFNNSKHSKSPHPYGGIWGGKNSSHHHNLVAKFKQRFPRWDAYVSYGSDSNRTNFRGNADATNNVFYNWGLRAAEGGESGPGSQGKFNMVNNYFKPGPLKPTDDFFLRPAGSGVDTYGRFYLSGNKLVGKPLVESNNRLGVGGVSSANLDVILVSTPFSVTAYDNVETADECYVSVLAKAGASKYRDAADSRIVTEVTNGTGGYIDSQSEVGGFPSLPGGTYPTNTQNDGIPDAWKIANGLDTGVDYGIAGTFAAQPQLYAPSGYRWIEEYAMSLVEEVPDPDPTYTVTLQANPTVGGVVTDLTGASPYLEGAVVQVRAITNSGYVFVNWTRNGIPVSTSSTFNFTVLAENSTLIANFNLIPPIDPEIPSGQTIKARFFVIE